MGIVQESLVLVPFDEGSPRILRWNTPFYDIKVFIALILTHICIGTMSLDVLSLNAVNIFYQNLKDLPASYHDFKKLNAPVLPPLLPQKLPALQMDLAWGKFQHLLIQL